MEPHQCLVDILYDHLCVLKTFHSGSLAKPGYPEDQWLKLPKKDSYGVDLYV